MTQHDGDPYTDAEFDRALLRARPFSLGSMAARGATLLGTYVLIAAAIRHYELPAALVVLPWVVEILFTFWLGVFLARRVVDCPKFAETADKPLVSAFWTVLASGLALLWLAFDWGAGRPRADLVMPHAHATAHLAWSSGIVAAAGVAIAGLLVGTVHDVRSWRPEEGPFVWTAVFDMGLRIGVALVLLFVGGFGIPLLGPFVALALAQAGLDVTAIRPAWIAFAALLAIDVGALIAGALLAARAQRRADPSSASR